MLRAIAGAVRNAAHAHHVELAHNFARSVAKRATGTLTAHWPDVLAASSSRHEGSRDTCLTRAPRGSGLQGHSKGDRLSAVRRSPIRKLWMLYAGQMWKIKREGTPEQYAAHVRVLRLLNEAQRELERLNDDRPVETA